MNLKKYLVALIAIVVLFGLLFGAEYLRKKTSPPTEKPTNTPIVENGAYENKDFGFRLEIPKSIAPEFKVERRGMSILFYAPTTETFANNNFHYATLFAVQAVTVEQAMKDKPTCDKGQQEYPYQCAEFQTPLGHNKYYYLAIIGPQDAPQDFVKNKTIENAIAEAKKGTVFDPISKPQNFYYESLSKGFSFSYPAYLDDFDFINVDIPPVSLPQGMDNGNYFTEKRMLHILPVQYCGLSGQCKDTTTNFDIDFGTTKYDEKAFLQTNPGKAAIKTTIGSKTVYKYEEGAEGEGMIYYFIFNSDNRMAVFTLRYINEQIVTKYQTVSGFVKYADQIKTTENIIKNFQFTEVK